MTASKPRCWASSRFVCALIILLFTTRPAAAEKPQPAQEPTQPAEGSPQGQSKAQEVASNDQNQPKKPPAGTSKDRLFYALPNFLTIENAGQIPPLNARQKFKVVARSSFDYSEYPWYGFLSGISQAENSEPGFGQGAAGYGKRYGQPSLTARSRTS